MRKSVESDSTPCVGGQRKKRFPSRWSLRHLIYSSPLLNRRRSPNATSGPAKSYRRDVTDRGGPSKDVHRAASHEVEIHQATSKTSVFTASTKSGEVTLSMECPLCFAELSQEEFWELAGCGHRACITCLQQYLRVEISESRVCISCPECTELMHPNEIRGISDDNILYEKYEDFMVRRVLAVEPDTRWCPAPDCGFAVIASECASCPKLKCLRPGCDSSFCYHCKAEWHPNQTCDAARAQRSPNIRSSSITYSQDSQHRDDIKPCPRCQVLIVKMDDGSCNHMMCAVCGAEFCWLCMKEISDLHYLSPSGCTFWGKKPWSRKKKILWQLGTLVGAPVGIALVAGITVPAMIIGIPVWVGRKLYTRYKASNKHKRNAAIAGGVIASVMISPILAGLAVGIGVPILLFYVYGVVPVSLCRSGGCGGSSSSSSSNDDSTIVKNRTSADTTSMDGSSVNKVANPSIGEASLSLASGSQVLREADRESASTMALAGSLGNAANNTAHRLEVHADMATNAKRFSISSESANASISGCDDGGASMRAMAGSVLHYKTNGSDSCSCVEDCGSERVRFDDSISYFNAEKTSIGSSCSFRARCTAGAPQKSSFSRSDRVHETQINDTVHIDLEASCSEKPKKSQTAILRNQFFYSNLPTNELKIEDQVIVELSNETLDKQSKTALIGTEPNSPIIKPSYV